MLPIRAARASDCASEHPARVSGLKIHTRRPPEQRAPQGSVPAVVAEQPRQPVLQTEERRAERLTLHHVEDRVDLAPG
jgi:hypothetical protein